MNTENNPGSRFRGSVTAIAKRLFPSAAVREIQRYRALERSERSLYLRIKLSDQLGFMKPKPLRAPKTARSILFVCFGNIMRSPMCEALFNREITGIQTQRFTVVSAGLNAVPGRAAHSWAISAAKEFGISLDSHRAQLLTPEMVARADAIFVMDFENLAQLLSRWPGAKSKVFLLGGYAHGEDRSVEIYDPYYLGLEGTERSYRTLSVCIQKLARWLLE